MGTTAKAGDINGLDTAEAAPFAGGFIKGSNTKHSQDMMLRAPPSAAEANPKFWGVQYQDRQPCNTRPRWWQPGLCNTAEACIFRAIKD